MSERTPDESQRRSADAFEIARAALGSPEAAARAYQGPDAPEMIRAAANPGPKNLAMMGLQPDAYFPPPTDHGLPQNFWQSYGMAHRRVQPGGWTNQLNVSDFPISTDIAGVQMALTPGGIRELHWHVQDEWAIMLAGNARITILDGDGHMFIDDLAQNDLWYFPAGFPHSIQGLNPQGCEFLLVFDDGRFSEEDTTLVSDWLKHVPREVLAKNWGVPIDKIVPAMDSLPGGGKYIFQEPVPPSLEAARAAANRDRSPSSSQFTFRFKDLKPQREDRGGRVHIVDSTTFKVAKKIAMAHVTVHPGALRELHWHPKANEWQYYLGGKSRMTVFFNHSQARTANFQAGDVGFVPATFGHYVENTGNEDLIFLELFKSDVYQDVSLNDWLTHLPPDFVKQHLNISQEVLDAIPPGNYGTLPR
jgi:oxalate decarboxylase